VEPKGSLSCLQQLDESSLHIPYFPNIYYIIFPFTPKSFELSLSGYLAKILYTFLFPPIHATRLIHLILLDIITLTIFGKVYKL